MNRPRTSAQAQRHFRSLFRSASLRARVVRVVALGALLSFVLGAAAVPSDAAPRSSKRPAARHASGHSRLHRVRPGETAAMIAARYRIPLRALVAANRIQNADHVEAGWRLVIPSPAQARALCRRESSPAGAEAATPGPEAQKPPCTATVASKPSPKPAASAKTEAEPAPKSAPPAPSPASGGAPPAVPAASKVAEPTQERAAAPAVLRPQPNRLVGESLALVPGRSRLIPVRGAKRVQIDDATGMVADVQPLSTREVLILGKAPGTTILRVWDERGIVEHEIRVISPTSAIGPEVQQAIANQNVTVRMARDTIILEGRVESPAEAARAEQIASAFSGKVINLLQAPASPAPPTPAATTPAGPSIADQVRTALRDTGVQVEAVIGKPDAVILRGTVSRTEEAERIARVASTLTPTVVNLIEVGRPEQVRVQVRMVDVDRSVLKNLGVRWSDQATWGEAEPGSEFRMLTAITADINALIESRRANTLAAPSLLVSSGDKGEIVIGGRLPIPALFTAFTGSSSNVVSPGNGVPSVGGGLLGQSVQFVDFGVKLELAPVVMDDNEIALRVSAEVSSIDRSTTVNVNGSLVPGFLQRRTETSFRMHDGNTLVIGGLISKEEARAVHKFPILADIPVLGKFFQSVRRENSERELIIFVTPRLVSKNSDEPAPVSDLERADSARQ